MGGEGLFGVFVLMVRGGVCGKEEVFPAVLFQFSRFFCFLLCASVTAIGFITLLALSGTDNKYPAVGRCQR